MTTKTSEVPSKLQIMAEAMREFILTAGAHYSHQRLARGLELALSRSIEQDGRHRWRLAMAREAIPPSADEIAICRRAFNVPAGSEESTFTKDRTNPKSRVTTTWHVVEVFWHEAN